MIAPPHEPAVSNADLSSSTRAGRVPLLTAVLYCFAGVLWITLSDRAVNEILSGSATALSVAQSVKGYFFVTTTALVLYFLLRRAVLALDDYEERLRGGALRYRQLIETVQQGLALTAVDGRVLLVNDAMCEMLGYTRDELMQMNWRDYVHPDELEDTAERRSLHFVGGDMPRRYPRRLVRKDGAVLETEMSASVMRDGYLLGLLASFIDRTRENEMRRQADLTHDIERRAQVRDEFVRLMNHELRSPLAVIRGNAELLQLELAGPINSLQRGPVDDIVGASDHLISLVNDVLDLSKMDADRWKLEIERFDARALVEEVVRGFSVAADRRVPLRFNLAAAPPWIEADRRSVRQVLLNLVSNAVKFTDTGSVEVCLRSASGAVVIEVCDTGIGIAPEDLPTLFEPFSQFAKGPEQRGQGTGLGLAITRRLVELHGGAIDVASKRGSGSRFTVRIPQPPRPSAASLELAERAADGREPSIDAVAQLSNLS